eukprot:8934696-Pyramimonas_sp.AAC.1
MRLHTAKGKSAMLFQIRGVGSGKAKSDLWRIAQGKILVPTRHLGDISLYAVRQYTHVGAVLDEAGALGPELAHRSHSCTASWK